MRKKHLSALAYGEKFSSLINLILSNKLANKNPYFMTANQPSINSNNLDAEFMTWVIGKAEIL